VLVCGGQIRIVLSLKLIATLHAQASLKLRALAQVSKPGVWLGAVAAGLPVRAVVCHARWHFADGPQLFPYHEQWPVAGVVKAASRWLYISSSLQAVAAPELHGL
jgi:hypothetical protein